MNPRSRTFLVILALLASLTVMALEKATDTKPATVIAAATNPASHASAPATAGPPAASTTAPSVVTTAQINPGDTAWMLTSIALVLMMTVPGLALFYAGMVRKKNVLATLMQSFVITCLVTLLWWTVGYSIAFTPGSTPYLGGLNRMFMNGAMYLKDVAAVAASKDTPAVEAVFANTAIDGGQAGSIVT